MQDLALSAIKAANFVLIPVQPSPYDIWATSALVDLVRQRIELTDGALKAAFVISRVIKGTKISQEISQAIEDYGLPVLQSRITQRVVFPASAASGRTVFDDDPSGEAARKIQALIQEIEALLN